MSDAAFLARMERRARSVRARALVRRWEYRQRSHAKGVWFRLRRVLASARSAWRISAEDLDRLLEEGYELEAVGRELEPPKAILFVPGGRLRALSSRAEIPVRLGPEVLSARYVALEPFEIAGRPAK